MLPVGCSCIPTFGGGVDAEQPWRGEPGSPDEATSGVPQEATCCRGTEGTVCRTRPVRLAPPLTATAGTAVDWCSGGCGGDIAEFTDDTEAPPTVCGPAGAAPW